jgi:heme A synthase
VTKALHPRAFAVTVVWTLGLLYLGSVVHATESSLACPDWPTCFGTMTPVMTGGVFWEHLHRLVAGGLMLMFGLATWLAKNETEDRPWIFQLCLAGLGLLVVQSIFGGLTVLFQLPDLVSTTHLGLALLFLVLATLLASSTGWARNVDSWDARRSSGVARFATGAAALVFVQSILGGLVRHMDAGMACPDAPLCLGQVVPPLVNTPITIHFAHRVMGVITALAIIGLASWMVRAGAPAALRTWGLLAGGLVVAQVSLGFLSVLTVLAVAPVSLHTLVAAALLSSLVHIAIMARLSVRREPVEEPSMAA